MLKRTITFISLVCVVVLTVSLLTSSSTDKHQTSSTSTPSPTTHHPSPINVVILGDSQTWIGGDDCNKPRGWNKWFKERFNPTTCRSYARSGATWTNTPMTKENTEENIGKLGNDNVIFNQVNRLRDAIKEGKQVQPQLIIIFAGANDAWFADKRPQQFDKTVEETFDEKDITGRSASEVLTLAGAVRHNCERLMDICPDAQIILLTPMQMTKVADSMVAHVSDTIAACARRLSIGVIRMDQNSCVNSTRERKQLRMTTDGVHTSEEGARKNGYYVAQQIQSMLQW